MVIKTPYLAIGATILIAFGLACEQNKFNLRPLQVRSRQRRPVSSAWS